MDLEKRKDWSLLRYNYYSAGRNELLLGNYAAAGILLGYAFEASLKHVLIESGFTDLNILNRHEPQVLMKTCRDEGLLKDIEVSDDFLDYINDNFKPRYPRLKESVNKDIESRGRFGMFGPLLLSWYDDILFEIDTWLYSLTKENLSSCLFRASGDIQQIKGRLFFHANYHACMHLENLIEMRKSHQGDNSFILKELEKGPLEYWSSLQGVIPAQNINNVEYVQNFSKRFHYAEWSQDEQPSVQFKNWNCVVINMLPWE